MIINEALLTRENVLLSINKLENKSLASKANIRSTFNRLLDLNFITISTLHSDFLTNNYKVLQQKVKEHTKSTNSNTAWNSHLKDIRLAVATLFQRLDLTKLTFSETIKAILEIKYPNLSSIFKRASALSKEMHDEYGLYMGPSGISAWIRGANLPKWDNSLDWISKLDDHLKLDGALTAKITIRSISKYKNPNGPKQLSTGRPNLSDRFNSEIEIYEKWKIDAIEPTFKNTLVRKMSPRDRRGLVPLRTPWSRDKKGLCASSKGFLNIIYFYCNYLIREHNLNEADISLQHLFNFDLLEGLYSYIVRRGTGYTLGISTFRWIASECKENSFAAMFLEPDENLEIQDFFRWKEELAHLKRLCFINDKKLQEIKPEVQGDRNVAWILDSNDPELIVREISAELYRLGQIFAPENPLSMSSRQYSLEFDLMRELPIRKKNLISLVWYGNKTHIQIKEIIKDEGCGIYFNSEDDVYEIYISKKHLKNRKASNVSDIRYNLENIQHKVANFVQARSRFLNHWGVESEYFFFVTRRTNRKKGEEKGGETNIFFGKQLPPENSLFSYHTRRVFHHLYPDLEITHGINPHGMRHLMASIFLKNNPDNYGALATLLMDELSTVIKTYARRDDRGAFLKIKEYNAKTFIQGEHNE